MSVQLIVFPQNYDGQFNPFSSTSSELLVNGIDFVALNSTTSTDASGTFGQLLTTAPPSIANTWYRFRTTSTGTPSVPTESGGDLVLDSTTTYTAAGVYQKLSNLTVGQQYTFTITVGTTGSGTIYMRVFDGTTIIHTSSGASTAAQVTSTFIATATDNTVMVSFENTVVSNITIRNISINPQGVTPNLNNFGLENGQVICDLYEDEDIPLSLSVDNFKNAAEKVQSYSKAFNLPATKRNNLIFDNMFEVTRTDDGIIFNPYNKTECVLKQDGFILFKGYLKMLDITDKDGEVSYNVNLYSETVALADILKDRSFSELDFAELTHDYNKINIKRSWNDSGTGITYTNPSTSGYRNAFSTVKYPFIDWNHQILISNGTNGTSGYPELTSLEQAFRPFINIKYLINRIFAETPFTWESTFFDSADFGKLFMDFNWGSDNIPSLVEETTDWGMFTFGSTMPGTGYPSVSSYATTSYSVMKLNTTTGTVPFANYLPPNYNTSTHIITSTVVNEYYTANYNYHITNTDTVSRTIECRWLYNSTPINYSGIITLPAGASYLYTGNVVQQMTGIGETLQVQFRTNAGTASKVRQTQTAYSTNLTNVNYTLGVTNITTNIILQTLRGELGQWEFIKGIMTMFNLVSLPDEDNPNNIKFEPYVDVFLQDTTGATLVDRGIQHDWTDRIDVSEMKLTPLTDLNKNTIFKFVEDDDDFAFTNYKNQVGRHLYGSKKFDASIASNGLATVLQGTKEIIAEPFAATVVKPYDEQFPGLVVPSIYAMSNDETEGFDNSPRILYNNGIKDSGVTYFIPTQNGQTGENQPDFLQFSHLSTIPTVAGTQDFHFGECQLIPPVGASVTDNLFNLYWLPYFNELYNPDTRTMSIKVNLSPSIINTFKFNDRVMIKNREFRVNKIDYKPNDLATVEFILIP